MASKLYRASSAVEGRNDYLLHRHYPARGFWSNHLRSLTFIHNFDLKGSNGTNASQRLFDRPFPNLFNWVMEQMGELPRPRTSKKSARTKSLTPAMFPGLDW